MKQNKSQPASKKPIMIFVCVIFLILTAMYFKQESYRSKKTTSIPATVAPAAIFDFNNQTIMIDSKDVTFVNGTYTNTTAEATATIMNRVTDSSETRAAAVIVDNPGGSGTFYYIVGAMQKDGKEVYSKAVLLGDRVKITSVLVDAPGIEDNGQITVNYLTNNAGAPLTAEPNIEATKKFAFQDDGNLIEVLN